MGKTLKIIVCGKKAIGKTTLLEQLIFNSFTVNQSRSSPNSEKYFATIEDMYIACWERDKGVKEKIRFYDTKGMENSKDTDTINQMRHLFQLVDGAVLVFSSNDSDSMQCIEKLKSEIEKSKDKKEICNFILIDNQAINGSHFFPSSDSTTASKDLIRQELQTRLKSIVYEVTNLEKRDLLCKPFIDLATSITQVSTKGSMNLVQSIKKPKVFSSNK